MTVLLWSLRGLPLPLLAGTPNNAPMIGKLLAQVAILHCPSRSKQKELIETITNDISEILRKFEMI